jgi:hypothetical protein
MSELDLVCLARIRMYSAQALLAQVCAPDPVPREQRSG